MGKMGAAEDMWNCEANSKHNVKILEKNINIKYTVKSSNLQLITISFNTTIV